MTAITAHSYAPLPQATTTSHRVAVPDSALILRWARHPWTIGYLAPVMVAMLLTLRWFKPGRFIAAGDVAPFLQDGLASEVTSSWNHRLTGAGSSSAEIARGLDVILLRSVEAVGGSALGAQQLFYALVLGSAAFGAAFFTRSLVERPVAVCVGGLLGACNPFVLVMLPNPLFPMAIGVGGVLGGLLLRAASGRHVPVTLLALATLPVGYLSVNPPLVGVLATWTLAVCALATRLTGAGGRRRALLLAVRAAPLVVIVGLWWIVPLAQVLTSGSSVSLGAQTGVDEWAWSHADNSLGNIITLKAHWGWRHSAFYPYAARLDTALWPLLRWILPIGAMAALATARGEARRRWRTLGGIGAISVLIAKGLHAPFAGVNRWLYESLPGFWLLREPMSKVGPVLVLVLVVLFAATVARAVDRLERLPNARSRQAWSGVLIVVVAGALAAPWPMWNGDVIPDERGALPSAHVAIPDEWFDLADRVNASPVPGKALVLPLNPYYQVTTTWGYHGVNSPVQQLVTRPVIQPLPGGYFDAPTGFDSLVDAVEANSMTGQTAQLDGLLTALGVSHVIVRHDITPGVAGRAIADPEVLSRNLGAHERLHLVERFAVAEVFEVSGGTSQVRASTDLVGVDEDAASQAMVAALASGATVVDPAEVPVHTTAWQADTDNAVELQLTRASTIRITPDADGPRTYDVEIDDHTIRLRDASETRIDGRRIDAATVEAPRTGSGPVVAIEDDDGLRRHEAGSARTRLARGSSLRAWTVRSVLGVSSWSPLEDCNATDDRGMAESGLSRQLDGTVLRLRATAHSACSWVAIEGPEPTDATFRITAEVRTLEGRPARLCVWQVGPDTCAPSEPIPASAAWQRVESHIRPESGTTGLRVYAYGDGTSTGTATEFRRVNAVELAPAGVVTVGRSAPDRTVVLDEGRHQVSSTVAPLGISTFSDVEDCNAFDSRDADASGLSVDRRDGRVSLRATAHAACSWATVNDATQWSQLRVRYRHRTLAGRTARTCLWQIGPNACADLPPLVRSAEWQDVDEITHIAPGTVGVRLYLYADGADTGVATEVEFDGFNLTPTPSDTFVLTGHDVGVAAAPTVASTQISAARHDVTIDGADGPFLLTLAESWDLGWQLRGLPAGWSAKHVRANGYANAWLVDGSGRAGLTLEYMPARTASRATSVSLIGAIGSLALLGFGHRRRRRLGMVAPEVPMLSEHLPR